MPAFAPVYTAPASRRSLLTREHTRGLKRKRAGSDDDNHDDDDDDDDEPSSEPDAAEEYAPRGSQSVNKKDPYHVAGWPRHKPLPGANFPHAPAKNARSTGVTTEEELARLNPPLYVPRSVGAEDQSGSRKRRHLDNLTLILHKCMLNGDWQRASRAWGLVLRTEVRGRGIDVRQNGRWLIGGELLMRRDQIIEQQNFSSRAVDGGDIDVDEVHGAATAAALMIQDEGFELARQYYERLILQYPHLQRAHHDAINALAIYPALFNVWIYEVHVRAQRARRKVELAQETSEHDMISNSDGSQQEEDAERRRYLTQIRRTELNQALPIVQRMDELMVSPPYDTSTELLHLRGTVALWLSDMHKDVSGAHSASVDSSGTSSENEANVESDMLEARASMKHHEMQASSERYKAKTIFAGLRTAGFEVSTDIMDVLDDDEDLSANHHID